MITTKEAALRMQMSPSKVHKMRQRGEGPPYFKLVGQVFYEENDIDAWVSKNRIDPEGTLNGQEHR